MRVVRFDSFRPLVGSVGDAVADDRCEGIADRGESQHDREQSAGVLVGLPDEECQSETDGDGETGSRVHARYSEPPK